MKRKSAVFMLSALLGTFSCSAALAEQGSPPAATWPSYVEPLASMGQMTNRLSDPNDPQLKQELYRFMYSAIAQGYFALAYADPDHPDFWPVFNQAFNFLAPNPDDAYYVTPIDDKGIYKISGFRGSVRIADFNLGSGDILTRGTGILGPTLANYDVDKLHIKKDGSFEAVLSAERPKGYKGDWLKLEPKTTFLLIRQISYDWLREVDGRYAIDRLDLPAIKPRDSAGKIAANLTLIPVWAENWTKFSFNWLQRMRDQGLVNKVVQHDITDAGGLSTQHYIEGLFDLAPDEALIYETEIPRHCRYWNIELTDEQWAAIDWVNRQSTLNGYTARLDKDGRFRAVISAQDPGVPNWLDNGGLGKGEMFGRWNTCSSYPTPKITKVKVADVRKFLPADTPTISAEARDASIRLRRKGAQLRRRW
jgi:hypothetical protein